MKRIMSAVIIILLWLSGADACVMKMLNVGVINSTEAQVLAEMLGALINERTGTTVSTKFYKNSQELYDAVKAKQVDIIIENTTRATHLLNLALDDNMHKAYDTVKAAYEKEKGLVWLKPFGFHPYTAPVLKTEVLNNFPGLPRVLEKLSGIINDEMHTKLIKSVESGEKPKKVARDFLKSKKLI